MTSDTTSAIERELDALLGLGDAAPKLCKRCGTVKPAAEFHRRAGAADGRQCYCKSCAAAVARAWQRAHPEEHREHARRSRASRQERERAQGEAVVAGVVNVLTDEATAQI